MEEKGKGKRGLGEEDLKKEISDHILPSLDSKKVFVTTIKPSEHGNQGNRAFLSRW